MFYIRIWSIFNAIFFDLFCYVPVLGSHGNLEFILKMLQYQTTLQVNSSSGKTRNFTIWLKISLSVSNGLQTHVHVTRIQQSSHTVTKCDTFAKHFRGMRNVKEQLMSDSEGPERGKGGVTNPSFQPKCSSRSQCSKLMIKSYSQCVKTHFPF